MHSVVHVLCGCGCVCVYVGVYVGVCVCVYYVCTCTCVITPILCLYVPRTLTEALVCMLIDFFPIHLHYSIYNTQASFKVFCSISPPLVWHRCLDDDDCTSVTSL